jgi:hypothetical protein
MNLAQLIQSAQSAANKAHEVIELLDKAAIKLNEFHQSGLAKADFPTWEQHFNAQLDLLAHFAKQETPATTAAKAETKN